MMKTYRITCDGHEITRVKLAPKEYVDQKARDEIKKMIAVTYNVPVHYLRMVEHIGPHIVWTDMITGEKNIKPKYIEVPYEGMVS